MAKTVSSMSMNSARISPARDVPSTRIGTNDLLGHSKHDKERYQNRLQALEDYERQKADAREDYDYRRAKESLVENVKDAVAAGLHPSAATGVASTPAGASPEISSADAPVPEEEKPNGWQKLNTVFNVVSSLVTAGSVVTGAINSTREIAANIANTDADTELKNITSVIQRGSASAQIASVILGNAKISQEIQSMINDDSIKLSADHRAGLQFALEQLKFEESQYQFDITSAQTDRSLDIRQYEAITGRLNYDVSYERLQAELPTLGIPKNVVQSLGWASRFAGQKIEDNSEFIKAAYQTAVEWMSDKSQKVQEYGRSLYEWLRRPSNSK